MTISIIMATEKNNIKTSWGSNDGFRSNCFGEQNHNEREFFWSRDDKNYGGKSGEGYKGNN